MLKIELSEYNLTSHHQKGDQNTAADRHSRSFKIFEEEVNSVPTLEKIQYWQKTMDDQTRTNSMKVKIKKTRNISIRRKQNGHTRKIS